jgi:SAM-dependent methyltransferase
MARIDELRARNARFWSQAAAGWTRHADRQDAVGRPLGAVALEWLDVHPGERVLDVGCGAGGTTAELAAAAGPDGAAVGVDLSPELVTTAAKRFPHNSFVVSNVETIGVVPGAPFDAAFSRMVLMLLADPVAGCAAIARSLRPGGRLAATVFRDAASTPWLAAAVLGAAPHVAALPAMPIGDEPGPFAFADPARIERILTDAGFTSVTARPHDVEMRPPDEPDAVAEWLIEVGPAGAAYRAAAPSDQAAARAGTLRLLDRYRVRGQGYRLPTGIWLITALVPAHRPDPAER